MSDYLYIKPGQDGAGATLRVGGELDIGSAPDLQRAVDGTFDGQDGNFHLDMSDLTFMDSTGAQALLHIHNSIEARGRHVVFEAPPGRVRDVLELLGLDQVLDITPYGTSHEAE
jgi:anti-sigma B factor antagonist